MIQYPFPLYVVETKYMQFFYFNFYVIRKS